MNDNTLIIDGVTYRTGDKVSCTLMNSDGIQEKGVIKDAKIYIPSDGEVNYGEDEDKEVKKCFICQNIYSGSTSPDKLGYKYSWVFHVHDGKIIKCIKDLKLVESRKVEEKTIVINGVRFTHGETVLTMFNNNPHDVEEDEDDYSGKEVEAILYVESENRAYLCQDYFSGAGSPHRFGKDCSWVFDLEEDGQISSDYSEIEYIKKCKEEPPSKIITTTSEDYDDDPMPEDWVCDEKFPISLD